MRSPNLRLINAEPDWCFRGLIEASDGLKFPSEPSIAPLEASQDSSRFIRAPWGFSVGPKTPLRESCFESSETINGRSDEPWKQTTKPQLLAFEAKLTWFEFCHESTWAIDRPAGQKGTRRILLIDRFGVRGMQMGPNAIFNVHTELELKWTRNRPTWSRLGCLDMVEKVARCRRATKAHRDRDRLYEPNVRRHLLSSPLVRPVRDRLTTCKLSSPRPRALFPHRQAPYPIKLIEFSLQKGTGSCKLEYNLIKWVEKTFEPASIDTFGGPLFKGFWAPSSAWRGDKQRVKLSGYPLDGVT